MLFLTFWLLFGQAKSNKASRQLKYDGVGEIYCYEKAVDGGSRKK